jgi:hypothetical protein
MHLTSIPLAPFENLRTFTSIEAGDLQEGVKKHAATVYRVW